MWLASPKPRPARTTLPCLVLFLGAQASGLTSVRPSVHPLTHDVASQVPAAGTHFRGSWKVKWGSRLGKQCGSSPKGLDVELRQVLE